VLRQYEARLGYRREAERDAVLEARGRGEVSTEAADDVLFDVEARALRYDS
jgi:monovalent cation/hydrogen antiporter